MERKQFLLLLGAGATGIFLAKSLTSCTKNPVDTAPQNVDFTLDLSNASYASLKNTGGFIYQNNIIIAHTSTGEYVALSDICTHAGCTVNFNSSQSNFPCPCHGSVFAQNGSVLNGPASSPLKKYNTSLNGTMLRIYS